MSFVGVSPQAIPPQDLIALLEKLEIVAKPSYYFLRWAHRVSGIWQRRFEQFPTLAEDIHDRLQDIRARRLQANRVDKSQSLEAFPSPEGQMFNSQLELRWKQKGANYEVLLLSASGSRQDYSKFQPVGSDWQVVERDAYLYASTPTQTETRFPRKFDYPDIKVAQRYFKDSETATVHFVALTVSSKNKQQ